MITQERARQIKARAQQLAPQGQWWEQLPQAMTSEENTQVRQHWKALPCSASYTDAFLNFLAGTTGEVG